MPARAQGREKRNRTRNPGRFIFVELYESPPKGDGSKDDSYSKYGLFLIGNDDSESPLDSLYPQEATKDFYLAVSGASAEPLEIIQQLLEGSTKVSIEEIEAAYRSDVASIVGGGVAGALAEISGIKNAVDLVSTLISLSEARKEALRRLNNLHWDDWQDKYNRAMNYKNTEAVDFPAVLNGDGGYNIDNAVVTSPDNLDSLSASDISDAVKGWQNGGGSGVPSIFFKGGDENYDSEIGKYLDRNKPSATGSTRPETEKR